jgi:hypothetical protein
MIAIILEGVLFVAFVATVAALLYYVVLHFTRVGVWRRQTTNRRQMERAAELHCPVHGAHREEELVRLPSGDRICPDCYKEALNG